MRIFPRRHICARRLPHQEGGNIQEEMAMVMMTIEGHIEIGDPLREGDIQIKVGDPCDQGGYPDRGPPWRRVPPQK